MVYSEEDIARLEGGEDDAENEDRAEDLRQTSSKGGLDGSNGVEDNPEDVWNLRKCSANALDVFATEFSGPVIEVILPSLLANFKHQEWPYREAAVFTLGSIAENYTDAVAPHLPHILPYLITLLDDKEPLIRQITYWTLGCYSPWAANLKEEEQPLHFIQPMIEGILMKMLDPNKRVQGAGASAFAQLAECVGRQLAPYCNLIIKQFERCFKQYKDRNIVILYDCVGTLAKNVRRSLASPETVELLMPALIHRWHNASNESHELIPLLRCLSLVVMAQGRVFLDVRSSCLLEVYQDYRPESQEQSYGYEEPRYRST
jgi:transportin-1